MLHASHFGRIRDSRFEVSGTRVAVVVDKANEANNRRILQCLYVVSVRCKGMQEGSRLDACRLRQRSDLPDQDGPDGRRVHESAKREAATVGRKGVSECQVEVAGTSQRHRGCWTKVLFVLCCREESERRKEEGRLVVVVVVVGR